MVQKEIHLLASTDAIRVIKGRHPAFFTETIRSTLPYSFGQPLKTGQIEKVNVALVSRDITGASTKHCILPPLATFNSLLLSAGNLKWAHTHSAGTDRAIYGDLKKKGVLITTSAGANSAIVAQSVLAAVLALHRKFRLLEAAQRGKTWDPLMGDRMPRDLAGQTAVIVGWGPIGQKIAAYLISLDIAITAVRHTLPQRSGPAQASAVKMVSYADFKTGTADYDWIILACPLTETTYKLIDEKFIARLSPKTHIVNVSRGDVVDEEALTEALRNNKLAGAYLDVFAHEPLGADSELWALPNTIVSPHSAAHSSGNYERALDIFLRNAQLWAQGKPLINLAL